MLFKRKKQVEEKKDIEKEKKFRRYKIRFTNGQIIKSDFYENIFDILHNLCWSKDTFVIKLGAEDHTIINLRNVTSIERDDANEMVSKQQRSK